MYHPQPNGLSCIVTDASEMDTEQVQNQQCLIAYFSRRLTDAERNYSAFEWELAI